jgi:hypothetical protein
MEDRLDLGFGGASTPPDLGRRPATSTGSAIITLPRADSGRRKQDLLGTCSQVLRVKNKATWKMLIVNVLRPPKHYFP